MPADQLGSFEPSPSSMSPVTWEFGKHIHIGDGVYINFEYIFLDGAEVRIGNGSVIAPRVQFLTAGHPVDPEFRAIRDASGRIVGAHTVNKPITIGENVWIGANALILGGVTIGTGSTHRLPAASDTGCSGRAWWRAGNPAPRHSAPIAQDGAKRQRRLGATTSASTSARVGARRAVRRTDVQLDRRGGRGKRDYPLHRPALGEPARKRAVEHVAGRQRINGRDTTGAGVCRTVPPEPHHAPFSPAVTHMKPGLIGR